MTQFFTCLTIVVVGVGIVTRMEAFPAYREWIALGVVLCVDVIVAVGLMRTRGTPQFDRGLKPAVVWGLFSLIFFCLFWRFILK